MAKKANPKKTGRKSSEWMVTVIGERQDVASTPTTSATPRGSYAIMPMADSRGNVIFAQTEEIPRSKFETGFSNCIEMAATMIERAEKLGHNLEIDSITLKLSANGKFGCSLIADAKVAGAIEVKIKRKHPNGAHSDSLR